jgi:ankyrin repeat protein
MSATALGQINVAQWLAEEAEKAEVVLLDRDENNWTALMAACFGGHLEVARWLVDSRAMDVNDSDTTKGYTALMAASLAGHEHVIKWLVEDIKAEVDEQDLVSDLTHKQQTQIDRDTALGHRVLTTRLGPLPCTKPAIKAAWRARASS